MIRANSIRRFREKENFDIFSISCSAHLNSVYNVKKYLFTNSIHKNLKICYHECVFGRSLVPTTVLNKISILISKIIN